MKIEIWDREGRSSTNEITNKRELVDFLDTFPDREPFFCEFRSENGYKLLVGVREKLICLQHSSATGDPPYMVAVTSKQHDPYEYVVFFIGNEATDVSSRHCLPFEESKPIISYFLETGDRSPDVRWEEI